MKALNRAIARTVSQLGRYGREGCHPPMLMALENHLDALLTMERKQLEVAGISIARIGDKEVVNITNLGCTSQAAAKDLAAYVLRELERTKAPEQAPKLSLAGMMKDALRDSFRLPVEPGLHIEVGDVLTRTSGGQFGRWTFGAEYKVIAVAADGDVTVYDDSGYPRVMSVGFAWSNFSVSKKQVEPAEQAQPAPDAIDMTDHRNWHAGDRIKCIKQPSIGNFSAGGEYQFQGHCQKRGYPTVKDASGAEVYFTVQAITEHFTWLRHA